MLTIKNYIDLAQAKRENRFREELKKLVDSNTNKQDAEFYLANLWLNSMHEDGVLEYNCNVHGTSKLKPVIHKVDQELEYKLNNVVLKLKYPNFFYDDVGSYVLSSIDKVVTKNETIDFDELTDTELNKLIDSIDVEAINNIVNLTQTSIYMIFNPCCGENVIYGFDNIMEVL